MNEKKSNSTHCLFSVVVATYNRPITLKKTLDCLEKQECNFPFEVIIVDDASTLTLPELGLGKGKRKKWYLIRNEKNLGRAATRNRGLRQAKGKYILFLDDDIWAEPQLLQAHYDKQKEVGDGVVVGDILQAKEISKTVWNKYQIRRYERIRKRLVCKTLDYGLFLTGNVSMPSKILKEMGGFNESFTKYSFEDTELGYRLHKKGIKFSYASNAVSYHFFEEDLGKLCNKAFEMGKSSYIFQKLHLDIYIDDKIQLKSLTLGPWRSMDAIKNLVKYVLYNESVRKILNTLCFLMGNLNLHFVVMALLPWLELSYRAKGFVEAKDEDRD